MWRQLLKIAGLVALGAALQRRAELAAFAYRGYSAIGGEIFIFPVTLFAGYYLTGIHRYAAREERRRGKAARNHDGRGRTGHTARDSFAGR